MVGDLWHPGEAPNQWGELTQMMTLESQDYSYKNYIHMEIFQRRGSPSLLLHASYFSLLKPWETGKGSVPLHAVLASVRASWGDVHSWQYMAEMINMDIMGRWLRVHSCWQGLLIGFSHAGLVQISRFYHFNLKICPNHTKVCCRDISDSSYQNELHTIQQVLKGKQKYHILLVAQGDSEHQR